MYYRHNHNSFSGYRTALACLNGHVLCTSVETEPGSGAGFCNKCGQETITSCKGCSAQLRGAYVHSNMKRPFISLAAYCHSCGRPYPWTISKLENAKRIADTLEELSESEREQLKKSLLELAHDSPETEFAVVIVKKLLLKVGKGSLDIVRNVAVDIASEAAKKLLLS